eukprot:14668478-Alexandrium_andersonii.AAC.1
MSASLVGSEMCIRDSSPPTGPGHGTGCSRPQRAGYRPRTPPAQRSLGSYCLLYTSDAADDM